MNDWSAKRSMQASKVAEEIKLAHQAMDVSDHRAAEAESAHRTMPFILRVLKRRALRKELERLSKAKAALHQKEDELKASLRELGKSAPPEQHGLGTAAKRSINFMILSFAQQLYIRRRISDL